MKLAIKIRLVPLVLLNALVFFPVARAAAQTFTNLHNFGASGSTDGSLADASLTLSGNTLYGTTWDGGATTWGMVFSMNTNGTAFTNLHSFTQPNTTTWVNSDGIEPDSALLLLGNTLYGITQSGGTGGAGVVFDLNLSGTNVTVLTNFVNFPSANRSVAFSSVLIFTNNTLFGTAANGGASGNGTVFKGSTNGTGFTNLHVFTATVGTAATNKDGAVPLSGLVSGTNFYGVAEAGGTSGNGTIFRVGTNGLGFTNLHNFSTTSGMSQTNSDGAFPDSLLLSGSTFYGTAVNGGLGGNGTVFSLNTDGTSFTNLYSFTTNAGLFKPNADGANPASGLILSGNMLYGTADSGGSSGRGTVFSLNIDGTGFTNLYSFTAVSTSFPQTNGDGANPQCGLILSGNTLYGTTSGGGTFSHGTIFSVTLPSPPQMTIGFSGPNFILSWPTNATGVTLQSATNLLPISWTNSSLTPVVVNGQNTVSNPVSGRQMFYRLTK